MLYFKKRWKQILWNEKSSQKKRVIIIVNIETWVKKFKLIWKIGSKPRREDSISAVSAFGHLSPPSNGTVVISQDLGNMAIFSKIRYTFKFLDFLHSIYRQRTLFASQLSSTLLYPFMSRLSSIN